MLTRDKDSIIHLATANESFFLPKTLDCKVDVNYQNDKGNTALHYAFLRENWKAIQTLMQKGADPLVANLQGISPPAAFVSMSLQKDPLLISAKSLVRAIVEALFLWQLQSQDFNLSQFRSWPAALTASFFGVLATQAIPAVKHQQMSEVASLAKEFIPVLGLNWAVKRTYHSCFSSFQNIKRAWNYLGYRTLDALPSLAMESLTAISRVALLSVQVVMHVNLLRSQQENLFSESVGDSGVVDLAGTPSLSRNMLQPSRISPPLRNYGSQSQNSQSYFARLINLIAQFANTKQSNANLPSQSSNKSVLQLTYLGQNLQKEALSPTIETRARFFADTKLSKTNLFNPPSIFLGETNIEELLPNGRNSSAPVKMQSQVNPSIHEPRPKGRGMIWEEFRTPPKFGFELPGPKGPGFLLPDENPSSKIAVTGDDSGTIDLFDSPKYNPISFKERRSSERAAQRNPGPFRAESSELFCDSRQGTCRPLPERRLSPLQERVFQLVAPFLSMGLDKLPEQGKSANRPWVEIASLQGNVSPIEFESEHNASNGQLGAIPVPLEPGQASYSNRNGEPLPFMGEISNSNRSYVIPQNTSVTLKDENLSPPENNASITNTLKVNAIRISLPFLMLLYKASKWAASIYKKTSSIAGSTRLLASRSLTQGSLAGSHHLLILLLYPLMVEPPDPSW